jgi:bacterioferritin-associated ferredoxin
MIACHCNAVNDRTIRDAIARGAADVATLTARCGAGDDCGSCLPVLERLLSEHPAPATACAARSLAVA